MFENCFLTFVCIHVGDSGSRPRRIKIYKNVNKLCALFIANCVKIAKQGIFMTIVCAAMPNQICVHLRSSAVSESTDMLF
jgi:hypothetical protein